MYMYIHVQFVYMYMYMHMYKCTICVVLLLLRGSLFVVIHHDLLRLHAAWSKPFRAKEPLVTTVAVRRTLVLCDAGGNKYIHDTVYMYTCKGIVHTTSRSKYCIHAQLKPKVRSVHTQANHSEQQN